MVDIIKVPLIQKLDVPPPITQGWYFVTKEGGYVYQNRIRAEALFRGKIKELGGKHIRIQLKGLGLLDMFDNGTTPRPCPYSLF